MAISHHVYFWMKEEFQGAEARAAFEGGLKKLYQIEAVRSAAWGKPAAVEHRPVLDQSWDYALTVQFDSLTEHDKYQVDPLHLEFLTSYREQWAKVMIKDMELSS